MGALGHIHILGAHVCTGVQWKAPPTIAHHSPVQSGETVHQGPCTRCSPPKRPELDRSDARVTAYFDELLGKYTEKHPCTASSPEEANDHLFTQVRYEEQTVPLHTQLLAFKRNSQNIQDTLLNERGMVHLIRRHIGKCQERLSVRVHVGAS